ncbi:hypothetical protein [Xenorhabdus eapokensis]|uniref:hypothetical protein n=1 Tax=Xenorhabdus eapokensis TaxID=1873482 RepID=UPI001ABF2BD5|nr:hypothetical protein [Xenorhabdus eapokensis]
MIPSVAGRRLQALCRPHPQNGRPPPKQVGRRSPVAVKNITKSGCPAHHKEKGALYCPSAQASKQAKSAHRPFRFAGMGKTGKSGSLTS